MKKRWVYMLSMLLVVALAAFGAAAEQDRAQDVSVGENILDIIPEEIEIPDDALEIPDDALDVEMQGMRSSSWKTVLCLSLRIPLSKRI